MSGPDPASGREPGRRVVLSRPGSALTPRRRQIFELMGRGLTNPELADHLGISLATVKTHISRILEALGVSNRTEAVGLYLAELGCDGTCPSQLPCSPPDFTGRETEIAEVVRELEQAGAKISGIFGMGGVGKTALALRAAERAVGSFCDGQIYLDLRGTTAEPLSPSAAMLHVIRSLDPRSEVSGDGPEVPATYRSLLNGRRVLLLMDDAADRAQVEPLVPPVGSALLITSRRHFTLSGLHRLRLGPLSRPDAGALVTKIAPHAAAVSTALARHCGDLPLALLIAGRALADRPDVDPTEYARGLADEHGRLARLDGPEASPRSVERSLRSSYDLLDRELREHVCQLSVFSQDFDRAAARAVWDLDESGADRMLGRLLERSLVEWTGRAGGRARYRLHELVKLFLRNRVAPALRKVAQRRHTWHHLHVLEDAHAEYDDPVRSIASRPHG